MFSQYPEFGQGEKQDGIYILLFKTFFANIKKTFTCVTVAQWNFYLYLIANFDNCVN